MNSFIVDIITMETQLEAHGTQDMKNIFLRPKTLNYGYQFFLKTFLRSRGGGGGKKMQRGVGTHTHERTDGRYQVHYLHCIAVDKHTRVSVF